MTTSRQKQIEVVLQLLAVYLEKVLIDTEIVLIDHFEECRVLEIETPNIYIYSSQTKAA